jgi:PST family polysaccharide transporter
VSDCDFSWVYELITMTKKNISLNGNIIYLGLIELSKYILPLITFPYLTKTLGAEGFGMLGFFTALVGYAFLLIGYGFDLSATAKISMLRDDANKLEKYFSSILLSKIILFFICVLCVCLWWLIQKYILNNDPQESMVIFLCFLPGLIGSVFLPTWFFQGVEKMKVIAVITMVGRIVTIPLVFIFVHNKNDVWIAALLQNLAIFVSAIISLLYIYKYKLITKISIDFPNAIQNLKSSKHLFFTSVSSNLYMTSIPVIIGLAIGNSYVGYYNVAQTIKTVCLRLLSPIYNAIYPRVNYLITNDRESAILIIRRYFFLALFLCFCGVLFLNVFAEELVLIIAGPEFISSAVILKILSLSILISVVNNFAGVQTLIPMGYQVEFSKIVVFSGFLSLIITFILTLLSGVLGAAWATVMAELIVMILLFKFHLSRNLNVFFRESPI